MARKTRNLVILLGVLGRDAKTAPAGASTKTTFALATRRQVKRGERWDTETDWHSCVMWNSEKLAKYLTKGRWVEIHGSLRLNRWESDGQKHSRVEIYVEDLILLDGGENGAPAGTAADPENDKYRSEW